MAYSPDPFSKRPMLAQMINDLLIELDQLADSNTNFAKRVTAAKAALHDTTVLENAIRDVKDQAKVLTGPRTSWYEDDFTDRKRASSLIIPPSLELRIAIGPDARASAPARAETPTSSYSVEDMPSGLDVQASLRPRAMTIPDIHKPLPPTPTTPHWPLASPVAASAFTKLKSFILTSNSSVSNVSSVDGEALLLHNITYEERTSTQLPFIPGQSFTRLPRRPTNEDIHRPQHSLHLDTSGTAVNPSARLPDMIIRPPDPDIKPDSAWSNDTEPTVQNNSSPTRRLRKRFEDYLIPRSILVQKPKHERSRTLSPSRAPRLLTKRARSTHDLRRKTSKAVKFAEK